MDQFFEFIDSHLSIMYIAMLVVAVVKIIAAINYRGFKMGAVVGSFFRLYKKDERFKALNNKKRLFYMQLTNALNIFLYTCIAIFLLMLAIYQGSIFNNS